MGSRGTYSAAAAPPDARLIAVEDGPQEPTAPDILPVSFDLSSCRLISSNHSSSERCSRTNPMVVFGVIRENDDKTKKKEAILV